MLPWLALSRPIYNHHGDNPEAEEILDTIAERWAEENAPYSFEVEENHTITVEIDEDTLDTAYERENHEVGGNAASRSVRKTCLEQIISQVDIGQEDAEDEKNEVVEKTEMEKIREIDQVGEKRAESLLDAFGSYEAVMDASIHEIQQKSGVSDVRILEQLKDDDKELYRI